MPVTTTRGGSGEPSIFTRRTLSPNTSSWITRSLGSDSRAGNLSALSWRKSSRSSTKSSTSSTLAQTTTRGPDAWVTNAAATSAHDEPQTPSRVAAWPACRQEGFVEVVASLQAGHAATLDGVWGSSCALVAAALVAHAPGPLVVVCANVDDVDDFAFRSGKGYIAPTPTHHDRTHLPIREYAGPDSRARESQTRAPNVTERKLMTIAAVASVLVHALVVILTWNLPLQAEPEAWSGPDDETEIELTLLPDEAAESPAEQPSAYVAIPERLAVPTPPDEPVVVYCEHGPRAGLAKAALRAAGFREVLYLEGHMSGWKRAELPQEATTPTR